ncbi:MAG: carboxylesterase family protein, partial [Phenylobacterium sp.]|nr:carboxylesterase family protein [Phenylobacterium sp.]
MILTSLLFATVLIMSPDAAPEPRAAVAQGVLVGRSETGIDSFRGVPFAAPPVGSLRWRAPRPA